VLVEELIIHYLVEIWKQKYRSLSVSPTIPTKQGKQEKRRRKKQNRKSKMKERP